MDIRWLLWIIGLSIPLATWWRRYTRAHGYTPAHRAADHLSSVASTWARRYTVRKAHP